MSIQTVHNFIFLDGSNMIAVEDLCFAPGCIYWDFVGDYEYEEFAIEHDVEDVVAFACPV